MPPFHPFTTIPLLTRNLPQTFLRPLRRSYSTPKFHLPPYIPKPRTLFRSLTSFTWTIAALITLQETALKIDNITGTSMQPTLSPHYHETGGEDWILTRTWKPTAGLQRGDIVCIMSPSKPESDSIKRVVALEGDTVYLDPKRRPKALRNGDDSADARGWDAWGGRVRVPHGHLWLEGDNWRDSRDSNSYGPVSRSLIVGRALRVITPGEGFGLGVGREDGFKGKTRVKKGVCAGCEKIRQGGEASDVVAV